MPCHIIVYRPLRLIGYLEVVVAERVVLEVHPLYGARLVLEQLVARLPVYG
jgi:hypothetical protein